MAGPRRVASAAFTAARAPTRCSQSRVRGDCADGATLGQQPRERVQVGKGVDVGDRVCAAADQPGRGAQRLLNLRQHVADLLARVGKLVLAGLGVRQHCEPARRLLAIRHLRERGAVGGARRGWCHLCPAEQAHRRAERGIDALVPGLHVVPAERIPRCEARLRIGLGEVLQRVRAVVHHLAVVDQNRNLALRRQAAVCRRPLLQSFGIEVAAGECQALLMQAHQQLERVGAGFAVNQFDHVGCPSAPTAPICRAMSKARRARARPLAKVASVAGRRYMRRSQSM